MHSLHNKNKLPSNDAAYNNNKDTLNNFDVGLRKFKRACEKAAIVPEIRAREFYEKPTAVKKEKWQAAIKRAHKTSENLISQGELKSVANLSVTVVRT